MMQNLTWHRLKYEIWPAVKVRLISWWWMVKYGGKKRIPPELIFGKLRESAERLRENLHEAFRNIPTDLSEEEKRELFEIYQKAAAFEQEIKNLKPKE